MKHYAIVRKYQLFGFARRRWVTVEKAVDFLLQSGMVSSNSDAEGVKAALTAGAVFSSDKYDVLKGSPVQTVKEEKINERLA